MKSLYLHLFFLLVLAGCLQSQSTICTAGNSIAGAGGSMSFSVGQTLYSLAENSTNSIYFGVQQPYTVFTSITPLSQTAFFQLGPNPCSAFFHIYSSSIVDETKIQLFNELGMLLLEKTSSSFPVQISTLDLVPGLYFVKLYISNQLYSFQITKH